MVDRPVWNSIPVQQNGEQIIKWGQTTMRHSQGLGRDSSRSSLTLLSAVTGACAATVCIASLVSVISVYLFYPLHEEDTKACRGTLFIEPEPRIERLKKEERRRARGTGADQRGDVGAWVTDGCHAPRATAPPADTWRPDCLMRSWNASWVLF